jgi:hydroxyacylglutathione hydrolase
MIKVKRLIVGPLATNCFLVFDDKTKEALILDPGDDADYIERVINDLNLKPIKIVATHGHYDHVLAVTELKKAYQISFSASKKDNFLLKRASQSADYFSKIKNTLNPKIDKFLKEKDKISLGKTIFKIIETPGHTPGSLSLYSEKEKMIFVGDLMFADGSIGRCDLSYSDCQKLGNSLEKIKSISSQSHPIIYSGHGPSFIMH